MSESSEITREEVAEVAALAMLELTEEELDRFRDEIAATLGHISSIQSAVGPDVEPMSHPVELTNVFRADEVTPGLTTEQALSGAPEVEDGRFLVQRILGED